VNRLIKILRSKPLIIGAGLVLIYTLSGFFLAPYLVRRFVPQLIQEKLHKKAVIGEVRINPYKFTVAVSGVRLEEPGGEPIAGFSRLFADFELKSLFNRAWTFRQVRLDEPGVSAVIDRKGSVNLAQLSPAADASAATSEGPTPMIIEDLVIDQGRITVTDQRQSKPASLTIQPLHLEVKSLSTRRGEKGSDSLMATLGDGGTIRWSGTIGLNPVVSNGRLALQNIQVATLWAFARDALNIESPAGKLSLAGDYELDLRGKDPRLAIEKLSLTLSGLGLELAGAGAPFLELRETALTEGRLNLAGPTLEIGRLAVADGRVRLEVDEGGTLNLLRIAKASGSEPAPGDNEQAAAGAGTPWRVTLKAFDLSGLALDYKDLSRSPAAAAAVESIRVRLNAEAEGGSPSRAVLEGIAAELSGLRMTTVNEAEPPLTAARLMVEGGALDPAASTFSADRIAVEGGRIDARRQADGTFNLAALFAPQQSGAVRTGYKEAAAEGSPWKIALKTIAFAGFQAAFSDLAVAPGRPILNLEDITVTLKEFDGKSPSAFDAGLRLREGGEIKAAGTLDPAKPAVASDIQVSNLSLAAFQPYIDQAAALVFKSGTLSTQGKVRHGFEGDGARTSFQGSVKIEDLQLVEPGDKNTFLGWKTLQTDQLGLFIEPNRLEIGELKLQQVIGKLIIEEDRSVNVVKVFKTGPQTPPTGAQAGRAAGPFPIRVRKLSLSEGTVDFADLSLKPQFATRIQELKGMVAGISSARDARAQVKLDGRVDQYGSAKIYGELNTFDPVLFTDIGMVFHNVEMTSLSPYTGKFAGRRIDSGKLSLNLKYEIEKSRLSGENQIVVDRLVLGERVESPQAVDLPLDLAVALLQDSNGVIDIGLPVSGNLDSPEFNFGQLIGKAVSSLIVKIVTSPFRALGALLPGGGEEALNTVAFEPGSAGIPPPEKEKLAKLTNALQKRPQLKLIVQGRYQPTADRRRLQQLSVRRTLAARLGSPVGPAEDPGPVDFSSPETVRALESLFTERLGAQALEALKASLKPTAEQAQAKGAEAPPAQDPGQLAKELYTTLAKEEPLEEAELIRLADARAKAIADVFTTDGAIAPERVAITTPAPVEDKPPVKAALSLEPIR
jgi:hypothetical protein